MDIFGDLGGGSIWDDPTFVTVSAVSEIVTREDGSITLEELLDQDELIQEAKGQLPRLLEFLQREDVCARLIELLITPADPSDEKYCFRYPYMAAELICCEVPKLLDALADPSCDHLDALLRFPLTENPIRPYCAGYWSKAVQSLVRTRPVAMRRAAEALPGFAEACCRHATLAPFVGALVDLINIPSNEDCALRLAFRPKEPSAAKLLTTLLWDQPAYLSEFAPPSTPISLVDAAAHSEGRASDDPLWQIETPPLLYVTAASAAADCLLFQLDRSRVHPTDRMRSWRDKLLEEEASLGGKRSAGSTARRDDGHGAFSGYLMDVLTPHESVVGTSHEPDVRDPTPTWWEKMLLHHGGNEIEGCADMLAATPRMLANLSPEANAVGVSRAGLSVLAAALRRCARQSGGWPGYPAWKDPHTGDPISHPPRVVERTLPQVPVLVQFLSSRCEAALAFAHETEPVRGTTADSSSTAASSSKEGNNSVGEPRPSRSRGSETPGLGAPAVEAVQILAALMRCRWEQVDRVLVQEKVVDALWKAMTSFPWHNLVHTVVTGALIDGLNLGSELLRRSIVQDSAILARIVAMAQETGMPPRLVNGRPERVKGRRVGFTGHLVQLGNTITALSVEEPGSVVAEATEQSPEWDSFVRGHLAVANVLMGIRFGGKPPSANELGAGAKGGAVDEVAELEMEEESDHQEDTSQLPEKLGNEEYFSQLERRVAARRASLQRRRDAFRARLQEAMVQDGYDEAPPSCAEMNETGLERDLGIGRATDKAEPVGWMTHAFRLRRLRRRLLQAERLQYRAQRMNQANRNALEAAEGPTKHTVVFEAWLLAAFATLGPASTGDIQESILRWNSTDSSVPESRIPGAVWSSLHRMTRRLQREHGVVASDLAAAAPDALTAWKAAGLATAVWMNGGVCWQLAWDLWDVPTISSPWLAQVFRHIVRALRPREGAPRQAGSDNQQHDDHHHQQEQERPPSQTDDGDDALLDASARRVFPDMSLLQRGIRPEDDGALLDVLFPSGALVSPLNASAWGGGDCVLLPLSSTQAAPVPSRFQQATTVSSVLHTFVNAQVGFLVDEAKGNTRQHDHKQRSVKDAEPPSTNNATGHRHPPTSKAATWGNAPDNTTAAAAASSSQSIAGSMTVPSSSSVADAAMAGSGRQSLLFQASTNLPPTMRPPAVTSRQVAADAAGSLATTNQATETPSSCLSGDSPMEDDDAGIVANGYCGILRRALRSNDARSLPGRLLRSLVRSYRAPNWNFVPSSLDDKDDVDQDQDQDEGAGSGSGSGSGRKKQGSRSSSKSSDARAARRQKSGKSASGSTPRSSSGPGGRDKRSKLGQGFCRSFQGYESSLAAPVFPSPVPAMSVSPLGSGLALVGPEVAAAKVTRSILRPTPIATQTLPWSTVVPNFKCVADSEPAHSPNSESSPRGGNSRQRARARTEDDSRSDVSWSPGGRTPMGRSLSLGSAWDVAAQALGDGAASQGRSSSEAMRDSPASVAGPFRGRESPTDSWADDAEWSFPRQEAAASAAQPGVSHPEWSHDKSSPPTVTTMAVSLEPFRHGTPQAYTSAHGVVMTSSSGSLGRPSSAIASSSSSSNVTAGVIPAATVHLTVSANPTAAQTSNGTAVAATSMTATTSPLRVRMPATPVTPATSSLHTPMGNPSTPQGYVYPETPSIAPPAMSPSAEVSLWTPCFRDLGTAVVDGSAYPELGKVPGYGRVVRDDDGQVRWERPVTEWDTWEEPAKTDDVATSGDDTAATVGHDESSLVAREKNKNSLGQGGDKVGENTTENGLATTTATQPASEVGDKSEPKPLELSPPDSLGGGVHPLSAAVLRHVSSGADWENAALAVVASAEDAPRRAALANRGGAGSRRRGRGRKRRRSPSVSSSLPPPPPPPHRVAASTNEGGDAVPSGENEAAVGTESPTGTGDSGEPARKVPRTSEGAAAEAGRTGTDAPGSGATNAGGTGAGGGTGGEGATSNFGTESTEKPAGMTWQSLGLDESTLLQVNPTKVGSRIGSIRRHDDDGNNNGGGSSSEELSDDEEFLRRHAEINIALRFRMDRAQEKVTRRRSNSSSTKSGRGGSRGVLAASGGSRSHRQPPPSQSPRQRPSLAGTQPPGPPRPQPQPSSTSSSSTSTSSLSASRIQQESSGQGVGKDAVPETATLSSPAEEEAGKELSVGGGAEAGRSNGDAGAPESHGSSPGSDGRRLSSRLRERTPKKGMNGLNDADHSGGETPPGEQARPRRRRSPSPRTRE